jgi:subtilisin-like proprotein convertase family protein
MSLALMSRFSRSYSGYAALALSSLLFFISAPEIHGQINANETFDAVAAPAGWVYTGFARNTSLPCAGTASLRRNFWSSNQTGNVQTTTWMSTGLDLTISFDYKIINFSSPNPATPNSPAWGEFFVEVSTDGGANYTLTVGTISPSNHTPSTNCANVAYTVPGASLPEGNTLRVRLRGQWAAGDYFFYIDNVVLQQDGSCGNFLHPGTPCDDGDPNTFSDVVDVNCNCMGMPLMNPTPCGLNLAIPDNGCVSNNYLELNIPVSGQPNSLGANVQLQSVDLITTHTWNGDLRIFLFSPNGVERELVNRRGGSADNFGNPANCPNAALTLQDGGAAPADITGNNVTGVFAPEQTLAGFNDGSNPNGNWTIRICDAAGGDVGALQYVALNFLSCTAPAATVSTTDDCPNGQFPLSVNLTDLGSASSVTIATSVGDTLFNVAATGTYGFGPYAFGTPVSVTLIHNDNASCNVVLGTFTSLGAACPLNNPSACGLNLAIPDNGCGSNNFMEKEIAVSGQPNALGANVQLQSVDLITTHTFNGDLRIFLVSPNGVQRQLVNQRGSFGDNFGNPANCPNAVLTLQDGGAAPTGITGNNVTGVFAPEQTLAGFNDGSNPNGNWTIRICDAFSGDVGALQYVALNFAPIACMNPAATVSTSDDCPNGQFPLSVNLTDLGSASSVTIATSVGDTLFNVAATGTYGFGPYAFGTPIAITLIHNGNASCNVALGTFTSTGATCPLNNPSACGLNLAIPDNGCGSNTFLEKEIAVSGQPNALGTNVQLRSVDLIVSHTWNADLRIFLVSPNGVQRQLVNERGGSADNFGNPANCPNAVLTLQDGGAAPTGITGNNVTGVFAPEQTLAGFNDGSNPNGNWTIRICDAFGGDVGALQYVALNFGCVAPQGTASLFTDCGNGQFFLNVDVTNLGQADTVRILANAMLAASAGNTGVVQIGPFASGSTVNVSLVDADDAACSAALTPITYTCPPPNDLCADAIPLDCDFPALGTNVAATGTGQPSTLCGTTPGNFGVWYTFVGRGGPMTVSTCNPGTDFDTKLNVYRGSCGAANLVCVGGNDDSSDPGCQIGANNRKSKVTFSSIADTTYYVLVTGFGSATGNFELTLEGCCDLEITALTSENEDCPGANDGSILAAATSSNGPITYAISGPVNQSNNTGMFSSLPSGNYLLTATDAADCEVQQTIAIAPGIDTIPPDLVCQQGIVFLNPQGEYTLQDSDVLDFNLSSDDCGMVSVVSISPSQFNCSNLAQTVNVTVVAGDGNGNTATCTAQITVLEGTELPAPWQGVDVGNPGLGNSYQFSPCSQPPLFNVGAGTANNSLPADNLASVSQSLCGDFELNAKIEGVSPNSWAGLMIRESADPGSKMIGMYSNLGSIMRWESRSTTGADKTLNLFSRPFPIWLRLVRTNNTFIGYYSVNGINYSIANFQNIPMDACLEIGLAAFSNLPGSAAMAAFSNVSVTSAPLLITAPFIEHAQLPQEEWQARLFPNPARSLVTLEFSAAPLERATEPVVLRLRNQLGQLLEEKRFDHLPEQLEWEVHNLKPGVYLIEVMGAEQAPQVLRFVRAE